MTKYQVASPIARSPISPDLSSPLSYQTARLSQSPEAGPAHDGISRNSDSNRYRPARSLPYELRHHCLVYLEEQLYTSAISLINNLLIAGTSYPTAAPAAFVPPPHHIALISTLLVHPIHTTRVSSRERLQISSEAFNFLQNLLYIVGPVNARLDEAFIFKRSSNRSRRSGRRSDVNDKGSPTNSEEEINSSLADESSLWVRGQDFWQVVGWSLNCSVKYPKRWEYWRVWLEYMLDVLEADWKERSRLDQNSADNKALRGSIALRYITDGGTSTGSVKRMVKSVLADGSTNSLRVFPEIFEKETRGRGEQAGMKKKREFKLELEVDDYGDYINNEENEDLELSSSQTIPSLVPLADVYDSHGSSTASRDAVMGGPEAMILRRRLLAILSLASHTVPDTFIPISSLYPIYHEMITPLPLPLFSRLMSPVSRPYLPDSALFSLAHAQLLCLLPKDTPKPATDELNQENLEKCFLPFAAATSSIDDNTKVSILVEALLRIFVTNCPVSLTKSFVNAVERGVVARESKCRVLKRGKAKGEGDLFWLRESGQRIGFLVKVLRTKRD